MDNNLNVLKSIPQTGFMGTGYSEENIMDYMEQTTGRVFCRIHKNIYQHFASIEDVVKYMFARSYLPNPKTADNYFDFDDNCIILKDEWELQSGKYYKMYKMQFTHRVFQKIIETYFPDAHDMEDIINE